MRTCKLCEKRIRWWQRKRLPFHKVCSQEVKTLKAIREIEIYYAKLGRSKEIAETMATVVQCKWGGWLAVSEEGSILQIGTLGSTKGEALRSFTNALQKWVRLSETSPKIT